MSTIKIKRGSGTPPLLADGEIAYDKSGKSLFVSDGTQNIEFKANPTTANIPDSTNKRYVSDAKLAVLNSTTGINTGNQTSIIGISGTKAQFNSAVTDGDILYVGDVAQYTDEMAQDAVGNMVTDTSTVRLTYNDGANSMYADVLPDSINANHLTAGIPLSKFVNNVGFEGASGLTLRDNANRNRANHTGTQIASTISDFTTASRAAMSSNLELKTLVFKNSEGTVTMAIPELPTNFYAENTVFGRFSGENISPFQFNSGVYGLITGGHANTLFGQRAGELLDVGNENTIMGHFTGRNLANPDRLDPNFTASLNTLIGSFAGVNLTTGYANFFGSQKAGANVTTAKHNVIIGKSAAGSGSNLGDIHDGNVIIGSGAAKFATSSRYNVLLGAGAGGYASCEYAILLGTDAGSENNLSHVFIAGGEISQIEKVFFGKGEKSPNPIEYLIGGTNGDGTDTHGGNVVIAGGQSTGNTKGGDLIFKVSVKGNNPTSGTTRQNLEEIFRISADDGYIGVGTNAPDEKLHIASGNLKVDNVLKVGNILPVFNNGSSLGNGQNYFGNVFSQNANINNIGANIIDTNVLNVLNYIEAVGLITSGYGFQIVNDGGVIIARNSANNQTTGLLSFNAYNGVTLGTGDTTNPIKFNINNVEQARFIGGNMLIGTTTDNGVDKLQVNGGAKVDFMSWKGMTTIQINAISNPADGMEVYNATLGVKCQYSVVHGGWIKYSHSAM